MIFDDVQAQVLAFLLDAREGGDPRALLSYLRQFFTEDEIRDNLTAVLQSQHTRGNLYQDETSDYWHLTTRCREQLERAPPF